MANEFDAVMLKRTDADLINILNSPAGDYQPAALESAKREFERRSLSQEQITEATQVIEKKHQANLEQANEPLGVLAKMVALLFPGVLLLVFSFTYKAEGYDRKAKELRRWTLYGVLFYFSLVIIESILASL
ncbi:hypothetical protein NAF17_08855 [Mucilaginibacter sp. RB4R14]|uniref:hypothetical protein n=1 Tax=Mucilaginibacter aurantiaciroseus TaxID=2949308 RepID=UPI0020910136|nr:hypothetical protein [Mucilaginibacter aurantiaciroseus]MCO5935649.1 hypothetical protein [Mucilaginibacter aurantiaciroseus]